MEFVEVRGSTVDVAVEAGLAELGISRDEAAITIIEEPAKGFLGIGSKTALVRIAPKPAPKKRRSRGRGKSSGQKQEGRRDDGRQQGRQQGQQQGRQKGQEGRQQGRGRQSGQGQGGSGRKDGGGRHGGGNRGRNQGGRDQSRGRNRDGDNRRAGNRDNARSEEPVNVAEQAEVAQEFLEGLLASFGLEGKVETRTEEDVIYATVTGEQTEALVGPKASILEAINELLRTIIQRKTHRRARLRLDIGGYNERRREALKIYTGRLAEQVVAEGGELMLEPMNPAERKVVHDAVAEIDGVRSFSEGEDPNRSVVIAAVEGATPADEDDQSDEDDADGDDSSGDDTPEETTSDDENSEPEASDEGTPEDGSSDDGSPEDESDEDGSDDEPVGGLRG